MSLHLINFFVLTHFFCFRFVFVKKNVELRHVHDRGSPKTDLASRKLPEVTPRPQRPHDLHLPAQGRHGSHPRTTPAPPAPSDAADVQPRLDERRIELFKRLEFRLQFDGRSAVASRSSEFVRIVVGFDLADRSERRSRYPKSAIFERISRKIDQGKVSVSDRAWIGNSNNKTSRLRTALIYIFCFVPSSHFLFSSDFL